MAWTTPRNWIPYETVTAALLNTHLRDNLNALRVPNGCQLTLSGNQSINNDTQTVASWGSSDWNVGTLWSVGSPTRVTAVETGRHRFTALARFASNSTGYRQIGLLVNGATLYLLTTLMSVTTASVNWEASPSTTLLLSAGDYVEMVVRQNSGGALNLLSSGTRLSCLFIGPVS